MGAALGKATYLSKIMIICQKRYIDDWLSVFYFILYFKRNIRS